MIPNPLDRDAPAVCTVPDTSVEELGPFVQSLRGVPKSGVHNPLKNVERYLMFGEISRKVRLFHEPTVSLTVYEFEILNVGIHYYQPFCKGAAAAAAAAVVRFILLLY